MGRSVAGHPGLGAGRPVDEGVGEPDGQFAGGAFGAVAAVDEVVGFRAAKVAADGAGGSFAAVGGADQGARDGDGLVTFQDQGDQRAAGDEADQAAEEGLGGVLGVVLLRSGFGRLHEFHADDLEALALKAAEDLASQATLHCVGLQDDKRTLDGRHDGSPERGGMFWRFNDLQEGMRPGEARGRRTGWGAVPTVARGRRPPAVIRT